MSPKHPAIRQVYHGAAAERGHKFAETLLRLAGWECGNAVGGGRGNRVGGEELEEAAGGRREKGRKKRDSFGVERSEKSRCNERSAASRRC